MRLSGSGVVRVFGIDILVTVGPDSTAVVLCCKKMLNIHVRHATGKQAIVCQNADSLRDNSLCK